MANQTSSTPARGLAERARKVEFRGESALEEWHGQIEVMEGKGGVMSVHISRAHLAHGGKKWHRESIYVDIDAASWAHLISAPTKTEG